MKKATRELAENLMRGDRLSLARAITLVESSNAVHRHEAQQLLDHVTQPHSRNQMQFPFPQSSSGVKNRDTVKGNAKSRPTAGPFGGRSIRLGIAGPPGAGKSTLIEALGTWLTKRQGQRVAVLTIDPSSTRTGGSILGDKTRMELLSRNPNAFVRASPSSGVLGGLAMYTRDVVSLCESAGYGVVIVETVGLGQSEIQVDQAVDVVALVMSPGGGDELQGVKKGIVEVADLVVVNKADGDLHNAALRTKAEYRLALQLCRPKTPGWKTPVLAVSAIAAASALTAADSMGSTTATDSAPFDTPYRAKRPKGGGRGGIDDLWTAVEDCHKHLRSTATVATTAAGDRHSQSFRDGIGRDASAGEETSILETRRRAQAQHWMMEELRHSLFKLVFGDHQDGPGSLEAQGDSTDSGSSLSLRDLARLETVALAANKTTPRSAAGRVMEAAVKRLSMQQLQQQQKQRDDATTAIENNHRFTIKQKEPQDTPPISSIASTAADNSMSAPNSDILFEK